METERMKGTRLSLAMIVKNEERYLNECLESVRGIVDEIIVVDTGSTDRTVAIAEEHGAKVFHYAWTNDFAAARNEALKHTTGDWILYLDADERLAPDQANKVRSLLTSQNVGAYTVIVEGDHHLPSGIVHLVNTYPRLFRRHPSIQFEGRVHEQITPSIQRTGKIILSSDLVIQHLGYGESLEAITQKSHRNLALLREELERQPNNGYARFQIGNTLSVLGNYAEAQQELERALQTGSLSNSVKASVLNLLAEIDIRNDRFSEAIERCIESLRLAPRQSLARWFFASALFASQRFADAVKPLKELLKMSSNKREELSDVAHDVTLDEVLVLQRLGECYVNLELYQDASVTYLEILKKQLDHPEAFDHLIGCQEIIGNPEIAIAQLETLLPHQPKNPRLLTSLAANYLKLKNTKTAEELASQVEAIGYASYEFNRLAVQLALYRKDTNKALKYLQKMASGSAAGENPAIQDRLNALATSLVSQPSS